MKNDYTFDNFVTLNSNKDAKSAAIAICNILGTLYNPLYIFGGIGLGKTHLLQAIANTIRYEKPTLNILNTSSDEYIDEFQDNIKKDTFKNFRTKYENADVFIFDLNKNFIDYLRETELERIFETMLSSKKQIVFASTCAINELDNSLESLKAILRKGLSVELNPPDYEARRNLVLKHCEAVGKSLPDEVVELICNNSIYNITDLYSDLMSLLAYSDLMNKDITLAVANNLLQYSTSKKKRY